jgi:hypothetical protein
MEFFFRKKKIESTKIAVGVVEVLRIACYKKKIYFSENSPKDQEASP